MAGKNKSKPSASKRNNLNSLALPGTAGVAVMQKLKTGDYEEALNIFYSAYIGDLGAFPQIRVLEDDGHDIIIQSQRGPFRFSGEGRDFFLMVVNGIQSRMKEQQAAPSSAQETPTQETPAQDTDGTVTD